MLGFVFRHHSNGAGTDFREELFVVLLVIDPTSHELGSPAKPVRFKEGQKALAEAEKVAKALERRFGSSDPRALQKENLRLGSEDAARLDRIKAVARIADRAQRAELSRRYELKRSLSKGLGLGM